MSNERILLLKYVYLYFYEKYHTSLKTLRDIEGLTERDNLCKYLSHIPEIKSIYFRLAVGLFDFVRDSFNVMSGLKWIRYDWKGSGKYFDTSYHPYIVFLLTPEELEIEVSVKMF